MSKLAKNALDRIVRRGKSVRGVGFVIYYGEVPGKASPRIVISSKIDKRAVVRNRLRRQIKSILGDIDFLNLGLVVIVRKELLEVDFQTLKKNISKALLKI